VSVEEPRLFEPDYPARLYAGGPPSEHVDTSQQAAQEIAGVSGRLRREVFLAIQRSGSEGCTDDELERRLEMRHQTASARRRELVLAGAVRWDGTKRITRSGRAARVWVAI
jgi:hypothetical protein